LSHRCKQKEPKAERSQMQTTEKGCETVARDRKYNSMRKARRKKNGQDHLVLKPGIKKHTKKTLQLTGRKKQSSQKQSESVNCSTKGRKHSDETGRVLPKTKGRRVRNGKKASTELEKCTGKVAPTYQEESGTRIKDTEAWKRSPERSDARTGKHKLP